MLIIGISGGTGSGKTTFVNQILNEIPSKDIGLISQDSYYKDTSSLAHEDRSKINFDHPNSIDFDLLTAHLKTLKKGKSIKQPVYSFKEHNRLQETFLTMPKKVILIEGILIFSNKILKDLFDLKVFIDVSSEERLKRRLNRDTLERNRDTSEVLQRYETTIKPMHEQFVEPTKTIADIIIPNDTFNNMDIEVIKTVIKQKLT